MRHEEPWEGGRDKQAQRPESRDDLASGGSDAGAAAPAARGKHNKHRALSAHVVAEEAQVRRLPSLWMQGEGS